MSGIAEQDENLELSVIDVDQKDNSKDDIDKEDEGCSSDNEMQELVDIDEAKILDKHYR